MSFYKITYNDQTFDFQKEERLIMKVYKKSNRNSAYEDKIPYPVEDTLIGLASVDLYFLMQNNSQQGAWFDIVNFSGHINGQLHVVAKYIEDMEVYKNPFGPLDGLETSFNICNMNLGRAIKRKFTELDEISERLRIRMLAVTGGSDMNPISPEISDEQLEEFEHDLNTSVFEDENENHVT